MKAMQLGLPGFEEVDYEELEELYRKNEKKFGKAKKKIRTMRRVRCGRK